MVVFSGQGWSAAAWRCERQDPGFASGQRTCERKNWQKIKSFVLYQDQVRGSPVWLRHF